MWILQLVFSSDGFAALLLHFEFGFQHILSYNISIHDESGCTFWPPIDGAGLGGFSVFVESDLELQYLFLYTRLIFLPSSSTTVLINKLLVDR
jgi:hypothetical protein